MTSQVKRFNIGAETEQVEFKKSTGELKEGVISIVSILNKHESGDLYFGVKNNGDVIGQVISDSTLSDVSQAIHKNIKPALYPVIEKQIYAGLDVVHVKTDIAVQYVTDAMDWRVEFDGSLERKEYPEIPVSAVREAVINAFGHRIIESMQAVEAAIYRNYIDIYSPGNFPDHVSPEQFIEEERKQIRRNPLITRTLYYSKDMEAFATGLKRINDACIEAGVKVEFLRDEYGFTVRFYRHCGEGWNISHQYHHTGLHPGEEKGEENRRNAVLELIKENPKISMARLSEQTGLTKRQVERTILTLKSDGYLLLFGIICDFEEFLGTGLQKTPGRYRTRMSTMPGLKY